MNFGSLTEVTVVTAVTMIFFLILGRQKNQKNVIHKLFFYVYTLNYYMSRHFMYYNQKVRLKQFIIIAVYR